MWFRRHPYTKRCIDQSPLHGAPRTDEKKAAAWLLAERGQDSGVAVGVSMTPGRPTGIPQRQFSEFRATRWREVDFVGLSGA
jgi:hypothetical protein